MSRHPKLCPKSHITDLKNDVCTLSRLTKLPQLEPSLHQTGARRDNGIFRVKRKHVLKACDRCRIKKTKCDGKQPCNRCSIYNHTCLFREKKATQTKVYSRGFVEMLEFHHSLVVKGLQKLYTHCIKKEDFPGEPLAEATDGNPLTHAILDRLGLIKQAEENTDDLGEKSNDWGCFQLPSLAETSSPSDQSPDPVTPPDPCPNGLRPSANPAPKHDSSIWDYAYNDSMVTHYQITRSDTTSPGLSCMAPDSSALAAVPSCSHPLNRPVTANDTRPYLDYGNGNPDYLKNSFQHDEEFLSSTTITVSTLAAGVPYNITSSAVIGHYHISPLAETVLEESALYQNPHSTTACWNYSVCDNANIQICEQGASWQAENTVFA